MGIVLNSVFSSVKRTKEMCNRGKAILAGLSDIGVKSNGFNPLTSAFLWEKICLSSILYGSEVWYCLTKYETSILERTQKHAAKIIQGFHIRVHDEIVRGMLGWCSMVTNIELNKLRFLHKLQSLSPSCLSKQLFLFRVAQHECLSITTNVMKGYVPEIKELLDKYGLGHHWDQLLCYLVFPDKKPWKNIITESVQAHEIIVNRNELALKSGTNTFLSVCKQLVPYKLYYVAKRHPLEAKNILHLAKLLSVPDNDTLKCDLCLQIISGIFVHIVCDCICLNEKREEMWTLICDVLGVRIATALNNVSDDEFVQIIFGKDVDIFKSDDVDNEMFDHFIIIVAKMYGIMYSIIQRRCKINLESMNDP